MATPHKERFAFSTPENAPKAPQTPYEWVQNQEWYKELPEGKKQEVLQLFEELERLETELRNLDASQKYAGNAARILAEHIQKNPEMRKDPWAQPTLQLYERYRSEFEEALKQKQRIEQAITALKEKIAAIRQGIQAMQAVSQEWIQTPLSKEAWQESINARTVNLRTIGIEDFLKLAPQDRLPLITKNRIQNEQILSGHTRDITIALEKNADLNMGLSLGQILPEEVRSVSARGAHYQRSGITGEFFHADTNTRLTIQNGSKIRIEQVAKKEEIVALRSQHIPKYQHFVRTHPEYKHEHYAPMIQMALEKGISPKFFATVCQGRIEELEKAPTQNAPLDKSELEVIATDVLRATSGKQGGRKLSAEIPENPTKTDIEMLAVILRVILPASWQESIKQYGYSSQEVEQFEKSHPDKTSYNLNALNKFCPPEYSSPAQRNSKGTTLCSRTARINLAKMGVPNPPWGSSARAAFESYKTPEMPLPPQWGQGARVADIFLDASPKNRKYGHRVAAFQKDGTWFVLDPYYAMSGIGRSRQPIPMNTYVHNMQKKGHRFWWAHYYG